MGNNIDEAGKKGNWKNIGIIRWVMRYISQLVFLVILILVLSLLTDKFLRYNNFINVLRQIATNLYMGCGLTMILITGGIDLSTGAVMAVAGMVATYTSEAGVPFYMCIFLALGSGLLIGSISGSIITRTSLPPFIVTYSMQSICRGAVFVITGANVTRLHDKNFLIFGSGFLGIIPYPVVYLIVVIVITEIILNNTKLGRHMYAVGGNEKCAFYSGISVKNTRMFIYIASGIFSALAGKELTSRNTSYQPTLGTGMEMVAIAAVVLGGTSMRGGQGAVGGAGCGALIIGFINNGLNLVGIDTFFQYIVKGIIILFAVYIDFIKNQRIMQGTRK
jgi:ribose transport system permease protein